MKYIVVTVVAELRDQDRDGILETLDRVFGCPAAGLAAPYPEHDCPMVQVASTVVDSLDEAYAYLGLGDEVA